ncbi:MAG TPA: hypothetical protein VMZ28_07955 [Kofleriaceae bacterium]|nr:hypothetical protein [Kofleriaceae bacterium]
MSNTVMPSQDPNKYNHDKPSYEAPARGGGGGGAQIAIGVIMVAGGIGLSVAGTGRVFIGLIVVGVITLIKGIANAGS